MWYRQKIAQFNNVSYSSFYYVLAAVKQNGHALAHASPELKNNPEIVLAAVKQEGYALGYASPELRNNPEIVLAAVKQNVSALRSRERESPRL